MLISTRKTLYVGSRKTSIDSDQLLPQIVKRLESENTLSKLRCIQVSLGENHSLALFEEVDNDNGRTKGKRLLFAFGRGDEGQLGIVDPLKFQSQFFFTKELLMESENVQIEVVSAGGNSSMALLSDNAIIMWGQHFGLEFCERENHIIFLRKNLLK